MTRKFGRVLAASILSCTAASAGAEELLCTVKRTSTADVIARSILLDIRQNIVALVYDENIEIAYGAPIQVEIVESSPKWLKLNWTNEFQKLPRGKPGFNGTNYVEPVEYFLSMNRNTLSVRLRAKGGSFQIASAEGKCARKKS